MIPVRSTPEGVLLFSDSHTYKLASPSLIHQPIHPISVGVKTIRARQGR